MRPLPGHVPARAVARGTLEEPAVRVDRSQQRLTGTRGPISTKWGVTGWPTIYILDHKGVIRFKNKRGEEMDKAVDQLLAEMEAEDR